MNVYVEKSANENRWWVHMDDWRVSFPTPAEAKQFVGVLTARLNAPHSLNTIATVALRPSKEA
ncbi:hypothetical protein [Pseudomonas putida]|uniref:hypothetical protein n=1 Tax=Pseudomonas putida TaxID=303 RepID=UPI002775AD91|nr:hypothetical protein [Pseudomonas putida]EKT4483718.1 hypothetical protein [Pseudomonas putida]MDP9523193.1 hypothetical protein [Pseudomonas putida]